MMKQDKENCLQRISNLLLMQGSFISDPGIYWGKMGIAVFFFRYARYTKNEVYEEYAFELIEEIQMQVHANSPISYARGLTGIGTGIEFLAQNGYIDADTDEILEAFDIRVNRIINDIEDFSLSGGLPGIGRYLMFRDRAGNDTDRQAARINNDNLIRIVSGCENFVRNFCATNKLTDLLDISAFLLDYYSYRKETSEIFGLIADGIFDKADTIDLPNRVPILMRLFIRQNNISLGEPAGDLAKRIIKEPTTYFNRSNKIFEQDIEYYIWLCHCLAITEGCPFFDPIRSTIRDAVDKKVATHLSEIRDQPFKSYDCPGIHGGMAGFGLILLSNLTDDYSWLKLI